MICNVKILIQTYVCCTKTGQYGSNDELQQLVHLRLAAWTSPIATSWIIGTGAILGTLPSRRIRLERQTAIRIQFASSSHDCRIYLLVRKWYVSFYVSSPLLLVSLIRSINSFFHVFSYHNYSELTC